MSPGRNYFMAHSAISSSMQKEPFSEWYNDVIERAGLSDKRYSIKGMNIWLPYGWKLMGNIDRVIRKEMFATDHEEVCFPTLIPEDHFKKESEHIKGFEGEVYWVTHGGKDLLERPMLLRPTSEAAMYPMFSIWVRSHADLPLKIFQIINMFRYETKQTRSFIRVRECHFFEAHTCHPNAEGAEAQIAQDIGIMKRVGEQLCLPYLLVKRPEWDKFPGAIYSISADTLTPSGRTLQIGTIHQYGENFARPYDITYEDLHGQHQYVHQTTYGMSERLLAAIVALHGDEKGLVLPPSIAPHQVVVIPIPYKGIDVTDECKEIQRILSPQYRVHLDSRDVRPGSKYYDWEIKGVPLRLEVGPRDVEKKEVTLVRRDTGEKRTVPRDRLSEAVGDCLRSIGEDMRKKALGRLETSIIPIDSMKAMEKGNGILKAGWCGNEACGLEIESTSGMQMLGTPLSDSDESCKCIVCGKPGKSAYVARTY